MILCVGAHPDDIEIGCYGAVIKSNGDFDHLIISSGRYDRIDQKFDTIPLVDIITRIECCIDKYKPEIIYTHCSSDVNRDHRIVNEAVLVASRPPCSVKEVYGFDITSFWAFGQFSSFTPNVFVDITNSIDDKLESLENFEGEMREYPHYRSPEMIRAVGEYYGRVIQVPYAEAFELIRMVR